MRLVVIGGVAAGMSAAARARRLDESAEIIVLERGPFVSFANCGLPYFVGDEITDEADLLVQTPDSLKQALNLDVRVGHEVVKIDSESKTVTVRSASHAAEKLTYDALVVAPGAVALRPPLPGLDLPHVHTLRTVDDARAIKELAAKPGTAAVLGAGFIGVEAAEALAKRGWHVTLVELADHVLPPTEQEIATRAEQELSRLGIEVRTGVAAQAVTPDSVELADGTVVPAKLVVLSIGVRADATVLEQAGAQTQNGAIVTDRHGRTSIPGIWAAGDATVLAGEPRPTALAGPANRAGRYVADDIFAPKAASEIPKPLGTAVVRLGDLTVAITGKNRQALEGRPFHTIHLHPNQHAGYFPGAKPISLLVHFSPQGQLLGAQAAGPDGTDKRIDVLATAIRAELTVEDLIDLDLAYAPPYGSAKDPVNMAGMIGQNVLDGEIALWHSGELAWVRKNALLVDVRSPEEFASGHVAGALNIPHTEVRERLPELRRAAAGRPLRLICKSGMRSYLAYRVLVQDGFDVATFSGGMTTLIDTVGRTLSLEKGD